MQQRSNHENQMDKPVPIKWAIQDYVPVGFSVLAGKPKTGKSWLALDMAIAVGTGGCAMGKIPCRQANVLYIDLENGLRRIKRRIEAMFPNEQTRHELSNIDIVTESPALDNGLIDGLEDWRRSVANPRLVVIDVLHLVTLAGKPARNAYENDCAIFQELQSWAIENGIAVLGLSRDCRGGAAGTTLLLDRDRDGIMLYVRGRGLDDKGTALCHDNGVWTLSETGNAKNHIKL